MHIKIIAVGKIKDKAILQGIQDFLERIGHDARIEVVEIKDSTPAQEAEKILQLLKAERGRIIALDEKGKEYTSEAFSVKLFDMDQRFIFVIGGPFGLHESVKKTAHELLALSKMTFTHEMARLFLSEQIYRAISIHYHRNYHKA